MVRSLVHSHVSIIWTHQYLSDRDGLPFAENWGKLCSHFFWRGSLTLAGGARCTTLKCSAGRGSNGHFSQACLSLHSGYKSRALLLDLSVGGNSIKDSHSGVSNAFSLFFVLVSSVPCPFLFLFWQLDWQPTKKFLVLLFRRRSSICGECACELRLRAWNLWERLK